MLGQLIASRPNLRRSPAGFAASVALHGIIIAGAVLATSRHVTPDHRASRAVDPVYIKPAPEPPRVAHKPAPRPAPPRPAGPRIIDVSPFIPNVVPPPNLLRTLINTDQPFEFRVGPPSQPGVSDPGTLPGTSVLLADQVEVPVVLDPRSPLPRFPQLLKDAGVEGIARLSFVVDTLGRVELGTVRVLETTHPAFAVAVQAALPRMRFAPARVAGRAVRQLVEFPISFRLER